jgi:hypothetical protein
MWLLRGHLASLFEVLPVMTLKFDTQIKEVKRGPLIFFVVRIFSGGFSMGLQGNLATPGF